MVKFTSIPLHHKPVYHTNHRILLICTITEKGDLVMMISSRSQYTKDENNS